jgi:arsenite methyltransferase
MTILNNTQLGEKFFDMQAALGITKHIGGFAATNVLLSFCHIETAREVLNAGCGIGVAPVYIAKKFGCRVVGIDISPKMIAWSRQRARQERVEDKVELRTADVLDLPFEANRFDLVFAESVLIFVENKARAIQECVRVTRPGGYVGINECFWKKTPTPEMVLQVKNALGPYIPILEAWQELWQASGLQDRVVKTLEIDARLEMQGRIEWIGWRWLLRAWGRALRLYITNPAIRSTIKETFNVSIDVFQSLGYGLFAGKKDVRGGS